MDQPIAAVGDKIHHAYINMTTGELRVNKDRTYTVSKVVPIEQNEQNVCYSDYSYHTEEGTIFGDLSCILADKKQDE